MHVKDYLSLLRDTGNHWLDAKAPRLGAALAFYAVISLAPLLLLVMNLAALVFGQEAAAGQLAGEIGDTVGPEVAKALQDMLREANKPVTGTSHAIVGLLVLLFGASGVFAELQDAMNTIWQVAPKPNRGIMGILRDRFLSFTMLMGVCFLLLASLIVTAVLAALSRMWTPAGLPGGAWLWQGINFAVSFAVITMLFALILKVLPDAKVRWEDVWIGAASTALLFTLGKFALGFYLTHGSVTSGYGAAGSLVIVLLWVYYASQILLFGATFTRIYAERFGSGVVPAHNAVPLTAADRAVQGIPTDEDLQRAHKTADEKHTITV
jgi:membrane protein